ncbi:TetR/AcrR family transcriptional regulator [Pedobacter antarcticus]|uniref:TetR/AcrR family transcriptional regulator n=1 Tax=Pedobacter antarcticus TaxID=34086 RepID=UPI001C55C89F|nr:TetR/AcrR family transcriptional regulator [Pedobacter antarcticus]
MPQKNTGTEELIKASAKRLLFAEGKLHATTQEIADAAGVSRTSLHYYFRSRDLLIAEVFQEAMQALSERLNACMESDKPFKGKLEFLIDVFLRDMASFPYQETFLVTQMNTLGKELVETIHSGPVKNFLEEVKSEMDLGNLKPMDPYLFLINLFSLLSYPLIMAPLYKQLFQLTDNAFSDLIGDRKKMILELLLNETDV